MSTGVHTCALPSLSLSLEVRTERRKKEGTVEREQHQVLLSASVYIVHSGVCLGAGGGRRRHGGGPYPGERGSTLDKPSCPRLQDPEPWASGEVGGAGVVGRWEELRDEDPGVSEGCHRASGRRGRKVILSQ